MGNNIILPQSKLSQVIADLHESAACHKARAKEIGDKTDPLSISRWSAAMGWADALDYSARRLQILAEVYGQVETPPDPLAVYAGYDELSTDCLH